MSMKPQLSLNTHPIELLDSYYLKNMKQLDPKELSSFVHGACYFDFEDKACRPWRFLPSQRRALSSCLSWHPGLFLQMAQTTASMYIEFISNASELVFFFELDPEPEASTAMMQAAAEWDEGLKAWDGFSCEIDGQKTYLALADPEQIEGLCALTLQIGKAQALPGQLYISDFIDLREEQRIRLYLPNLRGLKLLGLYHNGSSVKSGINSAHKTIDRLLVLGDSISQGFSCLDPQEAWPSRLSSNLGCELLNQSLGGWVFQASALAGLADVYQPDCILVLLGANYRFEAADLSKVAAECKAMMQELCRSWPEARIVLISPLWHDEEAYPCAEASCYGQLGSVFDQVMAESPQLEYVDGLKLMDASSKNMADRYGHPNKRGMRQVAERLLKYLKDKQGFSDKHDLSK